MSLASVLIEKACEKGIMLACAESCTGGMVAGALTDLAGSSVMFDRGIVTYTNAAKVSLLNVSPQTIDAFGAVSQEVAREMVRGLLHGAKARIGVSITGIAGPGGSEHKPEGRVCFGLLTPQGMFSETVEFGAMGRDRVRVAARDHALGLLLAALTDA